jgi:hypothetical protein
VCSSLSDFNSFYEPILQRQYRTSALLAHPSVNAFNGKCLGDPLPDGSVATRACDDAAHPSRIWTYDASSKHLSVAGNQCLQRDGARAVMATCSTSGASSQRWVWDEFGGTLLNGVNSCLTTTSDNDAAAVAVLSCDAVTSQLWGLGVRPFRALTLQDMNNRCADVVGGGTANGTEVQLWDCAGVLNQQWRQTLRGELIGRGNNCLTVPSPPTAGTNVVMSRCNGGPNQRWTLHDFAVVGAGGLCLQSRDPGNPSNGIRLEVAVCTGLEAQDWRML